MIRNYFKIAWRNLQKNKVLGGIQILGLAVAIATATLLYLTSMYEFSFNNFHKDKDRIGLLYFQSEPVEGLKRSSSAAAPLAPLLKSELPEIELVSRYGNGNIVLRNGDKLLQSNTKYVDADFLSIFSFPFLHGNEQALNDLNQIVIDETMAQNLFGNLDVVGNSLEVFVQGDWHQKIIGGVVEKVPVNSDLEFQSLLRFEEKPDYTTYKEDWSHVDHTVFVKVVSSKINNQAFRKASQSFVNLYYESESNMLKRDGAIADKNGDYLTMHLLPLSDYHLNNLNLGHAGSPTFPWILLLISGLVLFIACSNFINLSLANSLTRNKEIGTRKTLGGSTSTLIGQLWTESLLICVIALVLGLLLASFGLKQYNVFMNYNLKIVALLTPINLLLFLIMFFFLTLFAGGYPAWRIARQNLVQTLKGATAIKSGLLRNGLTIVQFSIAIVLIVATIVVSSQLNYLNSKSLGYNKSEVVSIPIGVGIDPERALLQMRDQLASQPWVQSVSASDINLGMGRDGSMTNSVFGFEYEGRQIYTNFMRVDYDYLKTLGITLLAGRDFDRSFSTDREAVIINKQMAEQVGGIEKVLNRPLDLDGHPQVIGVIDDFNFQDLRQKVKPLTLSINPQIFTVDYIFVRVQTDNLSKSIQDLESIWKNINPQAKVAPSYLDENTERLYKSEKRMSHIVISAAVITIVISCMGLFALALLAINKRVKEIGIRKVLGSSVSAIVMLLSKDFMKLILISFIIAAPFSWLIMTNWLENFAYHINLKWWMVVLAGLATMLIALFTVSLKAMQAARANPVDSLKDE